MTRTYGTICSRVAKARTIPITASLDDATPIAAPRTGRLRRLALYGLLAIAILILLTQYVLLRRAQSRLAREAARWRELGFTLDPRDPPLPPDDQNLAVALNRAAALVKFSQEFESSLLGVVPVDFDSGPTVRRDVDAELAANARALAALGRARGLTRVGWSTPDADRLYLLDRPPDEHEPIGPIRQLVSLCALDAQRALDRGDERRFVDRLVDIRLIARALAADTNEISDLISSTYDAIGNTLALAWVHHVTLAGADAAYVRDRLASLARDWADGDRGSNVPAIFARGAARTIAGLSAIPPKFRRHLTPDVGDDYPMSSPPALERVPRNKLDGLLWQVLRPQRIDAAATLLQRLRTDLAAADARDWPAAQRLVRGAPGWRATGIDPLDSALRTVLPVRQLESDNVAHLRQRMRVLLADRLAAASIACRLYAVDHGGADPARLDDLVPRYLPAVPVDPFSPNGAPIGYARNAAGAFIYGVADAGVDCVATGVLKPALAAHLDWQKPLNVVAFLNPFPRLSPALTAPPAIAPSSPQGVKQ
jgi:hypothetical protein